MSVRLLATCLLFSALGAAPTQMQKQKYYYPLGKRIAQRACLNLAPKHFSTFDALLEHIRQNCKLEEKRYEEALAWYLWDGANKQTNKQAAPKLEYSRKDRCAMCGMFVYKYPQWVAMAILDDGSRRYFDGIKDMLKYRLKHQKATMELYGQEYYSKRLIRLRDAWLLFGSELYGPMGKEVIIFSSKEEAQRFMQDHKASKIIKLSSVTKEDVARLDE